MADTPELAPARKAARNIEAKANEAELEAQIKELKGDIASITETLGRIGSESVKEAKSMAKTEAKNLQRKAEHVVEDVQEQAGVFEAQLKQTIREKPLTAVASAVGIGFLLAILTRR